MVKNKNGLNRFKIIKGIDGKGILTHDAQPIKFLSSNLNEQDKLIEELKNISKLPTKPEIMTSETIKERIKSYERARSLIESANTDDILKGDQNKIKVLEDYTKFLDFAQAHVPNGFKVTKEFPSKTDVNIEFIHEKFVIQALTRDFYSSDDSKFEKGIISQKGYIITNDGRQNNNSSPYYFKDKQQIDYWEDDQNNDVKELERFGSKVTKYPYYRNGKSLPKTTLNTKPETKVQIIHKDFVFRGKSGFYYSINDAKFEDGIFNGSGYILHNEGAAFPIPSDRYFIKLQDAPPKFDKKNIIPINIKRLSLNNNRFKKIQPEDLVKNKKYVVNGEFMTFVKTIGNSNIFKSNKKQKQKQLQFRNDFYEKFIEDFTGGKTKRKTKRKPKLRTRNKKLRSNKKRRHGKKTYKKRKTASRK